MIFLDHYNYLVSIILMMTGLYLVIARGNLIKKMMGLAIFQVSALLMYISVSYVHDYAVPIFVENEEHYNNPLPHVLMLTAIVVGVAVMAVGLAIIVRIKEAYGTIEEDDIIAADHALNKEERAKDAE